jgi:type I restriction enzyme, S subunit
MNADRLLSHFEKISDAPDAVDRLRRFILDLAVRGKLVEQDPGEEAAEVLLERIAAKKTESSSRVRTRTTAVTEADPYPLPPSWAWTQIADLGLLSPRNDADNGVVCSFVPMSLISAAYGADSSHEKRPWGEIKKGYTHIADGDVAVAKITPCFENGKSTVFRNLTGGIGAGTTELHVVRPIEVSPDYIVLFLKSPFFIENGIPRMTGTAGQKRLPGDYFAYRPFPLPPLAEQHRIVEKVDELMLLCDRLEASQAERESRRDRLVMASLNRLSQLTDPGEFKKDARFQLSNLNRLTTKPEHIKEIRKAILNLAVRGKLVPQEEREGTAADLLDDIRCRTTTTTSNRSRSIESRVEVAAAKQPYPLPSSWAWTTFGSLITHSDSGWSPKTEGFPRSGDEWGVLKVSAVSWDVFQPEENKQLLPGVVPPESAVVRKGDFLISRANTSHLIARCVIVGVAPRNLIMSDKIVRLHLVEQCDPYFLKIVNNDAAHARDFYAARATGTSLSMKNVSRDVIYDLPIPLPPLAEQKRIVAKVDELMAICDQLEKQLEYQQKGRRRLLEALLHEALEGVG